MNEMIDIPNDIIYIIYTFLYNREIGRFYRAIKSNKKYRSLVVDYKKLSCSYFRLDKIVDEKNPICKFINTIDYIERLDEYDFTIFSSLTSISFDCEFNRNIDYLSCLPKLKIIHFGLGFDKDITVLSKLTNLTELRFWFNHDISPLKDLIKLKKLYFSDCPRDLSIISNLTNLTDFSIRHNKYDYDLSFLCDLTNLTKLKLEGEFNHDISPLKNLTKLKSLTLSYSFNQDISVLGNLTNLTEIKIAYFSNFKQDVSCISNLTNLKALELNLSFVKSITFISNLVDLTELNIRVANIDLSPLINFVNLTDLRLHLVDNNINLSALHKLTGLKQLDLDEKFNQDISFVSAYTNLKSLFLGHEFKQDMSVLYELVYNKNVYLNIRNHKTMEKFEASNPKKKTIFDTYY